MLELLCALEEYKDVTAMDAAAEKASADETAEKDLDVVAKALKDSGLGPLGKKAGAMVVTM